MVSSLFALQEPRSVNVIEQVRQLPAAGGHAVVDEGARGQVDPGDGAELDPQQEELRQGADFDDHEVIEIHVIMQQNCDLQPHWMSYILACRNKRARRLRERGF